MTPTRHAKVTGMARAPHVWSVFPLVAVIRLYQVTLSPFIGRQCRYEPTCSNYALEALGNHGPWRGSWLAVRRVFRCHPFAKGGYDPAPPPEPRSTEG
ncbi:MAG TPA: membrane protein insertion efficiency factor YidD [Phycisphaerales bacterium]|nr:membrane protein insertion efficiency factor YidD [Phycisphaerales bacterium]